MKQAFIISQIGNNELDSVCKQAIVPVLKSCNLDPKRVDIHNEGDLLKSEIIKFIEQAEIIVADLTNERPNCYLEIGFAMGIDKFKNLILTSREDHNLESPNHKRNGPKVHFDLAGYDILYWDPNNLDEFKNLLQSKIQRRLAIVSQSEIEPVSKWDKEWIQNHKELALIGLNKAGKSGYMEISYSITKSDISKTQNELLLAAENAQIDTFGWPLGVVLRGNDKYFPYPTNEGVKAEIPLDGHYDYWVLRRNGDFFLLEDLFEDGRSTDQDPKHQIYFSTRIIKICEAILHSIRLYTQLGVSRTDSIVNIRVKHFGLENRRLTGVGNWRLSAGNYKSREPEIETEIRGTLENLETELEQQVMKIAKPLFTLFNFYELQEKVYTQIIEEFLRGEIN